MCLFLSRLSDGTALARFSVADRRLQVPPSSTISARASAQSDRAADGGRRFGCRKLRLQRPAGQFVHGKENQHPTSFPAKNKSEAQMCESTSSSGLCIPSPKSHFAHQVMASTEAAAAALASLPKPNNTIGTPIIVISCEDWSPQDDGIEVILPPTEIPSSKEDVDASGTALLSLVYGPSTTIRRLPLFAEICPE